MKNRNKLLFVLFAAALLMVNITKAIGQPSLSDLKNATPEQRAQFQTNLMKSRLNLDSMQAEKSSAINLKYAVKIQHVIKSNDGRLSKIKQAMAVQQQKDHELQAVFTKDQFKKYLAFEQELKSKLMARLKGGS